MTRKLFLIAITIMALVCCDKETRLLIDGNWYRPYNDGELILTFNNDNTVYLTTVGVNPAHGFKNASGTYIKDNGRIIFNLSYSVTENTNKDDYTIKFSTGEFDHDGMWGDILRVEYEEHYIDKATGTTRFRTDQLSFMKYNGTESKK